MYRMYRGGGGGIKPLLVVQYNYTVAVCTPSPSPTSQEDALPVMIS